MTLLGLLERRAAPETKTEQPTNPLAAALKELDIVPFDPAAVKEYKASKLNSSFQKYEQSYAVSGRWKPTNYSHYGDYVNSVRQCLGPKWTDNDMYRYLVDITGNQRPICLAMGWHRLSIASPDVHVPEYISRKASQISAKVPGAVMEVDQLETDSRTWDPFLVVKFGEEEYYIECWDEEDFERVCC